MGRGPHEGRERNLGPNVRVVFAADMLREVRRRMALEKPRQTLSAVVRRLVDLGMRLDDPRPVVPVRKAARQTYVRFDPEVADRLRALAEQEDRDIPAIVRGFVALALRESPLPLAS